MEYRNDIVSIWFVDTDEGMYLCDDRYYQMNVLDSTLTYTGYIIRQEDIKSTKCCTLDRTFILHSYFSLSALILFKQLFSFTYEGVNRDCIGYFKYSSNGLIVLVEYFLNDENIVTCMESNFTMQEILFMINKMGLVLKTTDGHINREHIISFHNKIVLRV